MDGQKDIMTWYQLRKGVYYSGRFRLWVGRLDKLGGKKKKCIILLPRVLLTDLSISKQFCYWQGIPGRRVFFSRSTCIARESLKKYAITVVDAWWDLNPRPLKKNHRPTDDAICEGISGGISPFDHLQNIDLYSSPKLSLLTAKIPPHAPFPIKMVPPDSGPANTEHMRWEFDNLIFTFSLILRYATILETLYIIV